MTVSQVAMDAGHRGKGGLQKSLDEKCLRTMQQQANAWAMLRSVILQMKPWIREVTYPRSHSKSQP